MRYDSIVNDWFSKREKDFEAFLRSVKIEDYKEYDFSKSQITDYSKLSQACKECVFHQIQKYKDTLADTGSGVIGKSFEVNCKGFPEHYIDEEVFELLGIDSEEHKIKLLSTRDPVAWASLYAFTEDGKPWNAREEQKIMLRCTSSRAIFRCGRRLGKCLSEDTMILTPQGVKPLKEIRPNDLVYAFNVKTKTTEIVPVKAKHDNGVQRVWELKHNKKVYGECTKEHRWLVSHERSKDALKIMHTENFYKGIGLRREFVDIPFGEKNVEDAYVLGAFLGDGCSKQKGTKLYFSSSDQEVVSYIADNLNCSYRKENGSNYTWSFEATNFSYHQSWCKGRYAHEKTCDLKEILTWNRESILKFLAGLLDTDGCVQQTDGTLTVSWSMQAKNVIDAIYHLLFSLLQYEPSKLVDDRDRYKNGPVHNLYIRNNLFSKRLLKMLDPYLQTERKKWKEEYSELLENNTSPNFVGIKLGGSREVQTYDLEIDTEDHLFLTAHGLVTHNSDALVIKMLFHAINLPDRPHVILNGEEKKQPLSILVITPRQTHSDNLWRKIDAQIKNSAVIRDSISEFKRYPYIDIRFHNGSKIFIMTAGTGGANAGLSIRSFSADFLVLDEGNYLGSEELKAATAILATNADCKLIVSSTPVGMQDFFYDWCFHSPMFKEFHYPTPLLPHWEKIKQGVYQDTQSVDDFRHEFMAEFSPPGHTVFRMDLIQKAIRSYSYREMIPDESFHYSIGVDWNSNAGTEIIVVGYNVAENMYVVVDNVNVPRSDWTQLLSCEAVIDLVLKWNPFAIIADEGYGGVQIELLRATALRSQDIRVYKIADILVPYQFSSKIEVFDPITKRPVKKSAKPFLVKTAVSRFEEENIVISNEDKLLIEQLSLYQIKTMSNLGLPTYWVPQEDIGDHRLDALMLAIMGFKMKLSFLFDNGGSVSEIGYIASRDKKEFDREEQNKIDKHGLQSLFVTTRSGQMSAGFGKRVGRVNVA